MRGVHIAEAVFALLLFFSTPNTYAVKPKFALSKKEKTSSESKKISESRSDEHISNRACSDSDTELKSPEEGTLKRSMKNASIFPFSRDKSPAPPRSRTLLAYNVVESDGFSLSSEEEERETLAQEKEGNSSQRTRDSSESDVYDSDKSSVEPSGIHACKSYGSILLAIEGMAEHGSDDLMGGALELKALHTPSSRSGTLSARSHMDTPPLFADIPHAFDSRASGVFRPKVTYKNYKENYKHRNPHPLLRGDVWGDFVEQFKGTMQAAGDVHYVMFPQPSSTGVQDLEALVVASLVTGKKQHILGIAFSHPIDISPLSLLMLVVFENLNHLTLSGAKVNKDTLERLFMKPEGLRKWERLNALKGSSADRLERLALKQSLFAKPKRMAALKRWLELEDLNANQGIKDSVTQQELERLRCDMGFKQWSDLEKEEAQGRLQGPEQQERLKAFRKNFNQTRGVFEKELSGLKKTYKHNRLQQLYAIKELKKVKYLEHLAFLDISHLHCDELSADFMGNIEWFLDLLKQQKHLKELNISMLSGLDTVTRPEDQARLNGLLRNFLALPAFHSFALEGWPLDSITFDLFLSNSRWVHLIMGPVTIDSEQFKPGICPQGFFKCLSLRNPKRVDGQPWGSKTELLNLMHAAANMNVLRLFSDALPATQEEVEQIEVLTQETCRILISQ